MAHAVHRPLGILTAILALTCSVISACSVSTAPVSLQSGPDAAASRVDELRERLYDSADEGVMIVAHRGHHLHHPENSIASIEAAIAIGAHMVEIDVHATADDELVLMHDWNVGRTTTGWGDMDTFTLRAIKELHLLHGIRVTNERVPTLAEALEAARGEILVNIDQKGLSLERCVREVAEFGMLDHSVYKIEWTEEGRDSAHAILERWPDAIVMPIVRNEEQLDRALTERSRTPIEFASGGSGNLAHMSASHVSRAREGGRRAWCNSLGGWNLPGLGDYDYPLRGAAIFHELRGRGFTIIQTDLAEIALDAFASTPASTRQWDEEAVNMTHSLGQARLPTLNPARVPTERLVTEDWLAQAHERVERDLRETALDRVRVVFLGDSITQQWLEVGARHWNASFGGEEPPYPALNLGVAGDRTEHLLYRVLPSALGGLGQLDDAQLDPDVVVLMIGTNNLWAHTPDLIVGGIGATLELLLEQFTHADVVLSTVLPTSDPSINRSVTSVNAGILGLSDSDRVRVLDLHSHATGADGSQNNALFIDGVHLNESGYGVWADALLPMLDGLIDREKDPE